MYKNISESPERWVILKLRSGYYKVFGSWSGGYLDADRWKLNSGIVEVKEDKNFYYFVGFSGSCYKCHKKTYGINNSYGSSVLSNILEQGKGEVELMEDVEDWLKVIE